MARLLSDEAKEARARGASVISEDSGAVFTGCVRLSGLVTPAKATIRDKGGVVRRSR
jgi:hypothetical protein